MLADRVRMRSSSGIDEMAILTYVSNSALTIENMGEFIQMTIPSGVSNLRGAFVFEKKINLTNINTIIVTNSFTKSTPPIPQLTTLDVSAYSGEYYLKFFLQRGTPAMYQTKFAFGIANDSQLNYIETDFLTYVDIYRSFGDTSIDIAKIYEFSLS